jgi:hypothetical protein
MTPMQTDREVRHTNSNCNRKASRGAGKKPEEGTIYLSSSLNTYCYSGSIRGTLSDDDVIDIR